MESRNIGYARRVRSSRRVSIESLEPRAYFDLVPSFASALPTALVAGVKNTSSVTVDLTNTGGSSIKGAYTLTLFASTSATLGAAVDAQVAAISKSAPTLPAGKFTAVKFKLSDFPVVANGPYFLLAQVIGNLAGAGDNVAASSSTIAVSAPFVDLSDTVSVVAPASAQLLPGKPFTIALDVFNNGNVLASGSLKTDLSVSPNADGLAPGRQFVLTDSIHLAGANKIFRINQKVPIGFQPATYFFVANVDPANTFSESNIDNNMAVSPSALTVLDPFPNLLGSYSGLDIIRKGPDKGGRPTIVLDFVSESETTGALTANGTLIETDGTTAAFNFVGAITTKGAFSGKTSSPGSIRVATFKGKLAGHILTGLVSNTDGNSGTFSLTLAAN